MDIYGKGVRPQGADRGKTSGKYSGDRKLYRERLKAGYDKATAFAYTNPQEVGAIGYCFGGAGVLEMGRAGLPVKALVTFHGSLENPNPEDAANIRGETLVLHGAADPYVPPAQVAAFETNMRTYRKPLTIIKYPGAVHAFTVPSAGSDPSTGAAYNARGRQGELRRDAQVPQVRVRALGSSGRGRSADTPVRVSTAGRA